MKIKIESGIPITSKVGALRVGSWTTTLRKMKPGQSFTVPAVRNRNTICMTARYHQFRIITRKLENGKGYRIWKVK